MSPLSVVGIGVAITFDLILPAALLVLLARANYRHRDSRASEQRFWGFTTAYTLALSAVCLIALQAALQDNGYPTLVAVFFGLPMSAIPSIFNSNVIHLFFTQAEWANLGYPIVMSAFLVGLIAWAILLPVAIRRLSQRSALRQRERQIRARREAEVDL